MPVRPPFCRWPGTPTSACSCNGRLAGDVMQVTGPAGRRRRGDADTSWQIAGRGRVSSEPTRLWSMFGRSCCAPVFRRTESAPDDLGRGLGRRTPFMIQAREGVALHQLLKDLLASEPSEVLTTPTALEMARRQLVASVVLVLFQLAGAQEPARVLGERRREIARAAEELHTGTAARIRPRSYKLDRVSSALAVSPRTVQLESPPPLCGRRLRPRWSSSSTA